MRRPGHVVQVYLPRRAIRRRLRSHPWRSQEEDHRESRGLPQKGKAPFCLRLPFLDQTGYPIRKLFYWITRLV